MIRAYLKQLLTRILPDRVVFPNQNAWLRMLLPNTKIDFEKHVGDGLGSNVFMAPILWIWRASLEARLGVLTQTKDGEDLTSDHELVDLLRNPNPHQSGSALLLGMFASWFTDGNAYLLKVRDGTGKVRQLWYCPHWLIDPEEDHQDPTVFISRYRYKPGGTEEVEIAVSEVVHLRHGVDPRNVRKGLSPMKILLREIFNDDEAANFVASLLLNGGVPGIVLSPRDPNSVSHESLKATKDYIKQQFGRSKRGEPLALGAPTDIKEFGYDPQKMNLDIVRNVSEERVCAVLAMPAAVVGFGSGMEQTKVGATLSELHRIAWVDCVIPNQELMAEELHRNLAADFRLKPNQRLAWDRDKVYALSEDRGKEASRLAELVAAAVMKRSEARRKLRLEVSPEDDVYHLPFSVTLEGPGAPPLLPETATATKAARRRLDKRQSQILRSMDKIKAAHSKVLERRMVDFFSKLGDAARRAYLETGGKADQDELRVEAVFSSMNVPRFRQELRGVMGAHFVAVHRDTQRVLAGMGLGIGLGDEQELRVLARGGTQAGLVDLTTDARRKALEVIRAGREAGRGPEDVATDLAKVVPAGRFNDPRTRATLIARSETRVAQTESAMLAYRATDGVDSVMIIDARLPGETDEDCEEANGQVVDFQTAEAMIAAEHPNGTRDVVPIFGGRA